MKGSARDRWKQKTKIEGERYMKGSARDRWKQKTKIEAERYIRECERQMETEDID